MGATSLGRSPARRLPVGAEVLPGGGTHFRVWAPRRARVEIVVESDGSRAALEFDSQRALELDSRHAFELEAEGGGYFSALAPGLGDGTLYRFRLDGDDYLYPDPASRFQPEGPHGPSRVVDPTKIRGTDGEWRGASLKGLGVDELHVGP